MNWKCVGNLHVTLIFQPSPFSLFQLLFFVVIVKCLKADWTKFYKISLSVSWNIVCCYLLISGLLPCWQNSTRERTWSILKSEEKHNEVSCSQSSQKILSTSIWMSQKCEGPRMSNKKVIKKWPSIQIFKPLLNCQVLCPFCVCVSKSLKMDKDWH